MNRTGVTRFLPAAAAAAAIVGCLAVAGTVAGATPKAFRPAAPGALTPANATTVEALPAFAWGGVKGAEAYEFQIAADAGFNAPVLGRGKDHFQTRNLRATLKETVPNGTYYWRVRAVSENGSASPWTPPRSVRKAWGATAALQSPAHGSVLTVPQSPIRLSWTPVRRASGYLVSIGTDPLLGSLVGGKAFETTATTFTRTAALPPSTYFWAIAPVDAKGNPGTPSPVQSFTVAWPSQTTPRVVDLFNGSEVFDPEFSWDPVAGAARYEVEVNPSQDFPPGSKVCCSPATIATSLSPTKVLRDNTYYWRVRAIDADGNTGQWNYGPAFTKTFDKVPPVAAPSVKNVRMRDNLSDPGGDLDAVAAGYQTKVPIASWDPVPGASSYEVEVTPFVEVEPGRKACNWTANTGHWRSTTATTHWTALGSSWNNIRPYPDDLGVANDGSTALTPGAAYCVRVRARTDRDTHGDDVYGDYTYLDDGTGAAFTWTGLPAGGACSPSCNVGYLGSDDYVVPVTGTTTTRMPLFTWKPISGKGSYFVLVAKDPAFSNLVDYAFTQLPAYAPRTRTTVTTYPDETTLYYWAVLPAVGSNGSGAAGNPLLAAAKSFHKQSVPPALLTPALNADVISQPEFRWTPAEGARRYRLQVAQDPTFGNPLDDVVTSSTAYTSNTTYPADTVLYWRVRADDENLIGLTWSPTGTFRKRLQTPVPSTSNATAGDFIPTWSWDPLLGAVSYDVAVDLPDGTHRDLTGLRSATLTPVLMYGTGVFRWKVRANFPKAASGSVPGPYTQTYSFTRTIGEPGGARADASKNHILLSWEPKAGAKQYRVEISTRADFARNVEDVMTENTSYAPLLTHQAYLAGETLYWRVAAVDEGRNVGDFTQAQVIALSKRMRVSARGRLSRGKAASITVSVQNLARRPIAGATVRVSGAGVRPHAARTNARGTVKFRVRPTKRGKLVFRATKSRYLPATLALGVKR